MTPDQRAVDGHARRLVERLGDDDRFRTDPASAIQELFGITVHRRSDVNSDCDIDGSYDHERRLIIVDSTAIATRQRFTLLHELGHALGREDDALQDWLFSWPGSGRVEEERIANAFASMVLLPDKLVEDLIPDFGPCAYDVLQLARQSTASREAACVRAVQSLRGAGMVVLSQGSTIQLALSRGLPFGLRRGTDMGEDSIFAMAGTRESLRRSGVRLRLPGSDVMSSTFEADAVTDAQGYTFTVLMGSGAPWVGLTVTPDGPEGHEIDCEECDRTRTTYAAVCRRCGDRPCPDHGCSCAHQRSSWTRRRCISCNVELPLAAARDAMVCDDCG
jgi:Zn-dependent peptidase ImmA (M78 family)